MSFDYKCFVPESAMANPLVPRIFLYKPSTVSTDDSYGDSINDIIDDDYFIDQYSILKVGDIIRVFASGILGGANLVITACSSAGVTVDILGSVIAYADIDEVMAIGAHATDLIVPDNALVTKCFYDVGTTFTDGADDSATIALHLQGAGDLVAAIAISAGGDVFDAGVRGTLCGTPILGADSAHDTAIEIAALMAASVIKMTAARTLTITIADDDITAGAMRVYVEYVKGL